MAKADLSSNGVTLAAARLPFPEQIAFFRQGLGKLVPTAKWDDITKSAHDAAFMVAGAAKADLLADLAAAIDRAIAEGAGLEAFRKDFKAAVKKHDWHGWTGERSKKGRAWRTRIIYKTNMLTSYAAGRHAQLVDGGYSHWVYRHKEGVRHPRPDHQAWDGLTLPPDHPFWRAHYPPNGWMCHCYVIGTNNPERARRLGADPDKQPPDGWDAVDAKTGEPVGIDKGWGYAPGATVADTVRAMAAKTIQWDYTLAKAYMQAVPARVRDLLARGMRDLPSLADAVRRYARAVVERRQVAPYRTLGLLTTGDVSRLRASGLDAAGFDYALDASAVRHVMREHGAPESEAPRGQIPVGIPDFALLPQMLNEPDDMRVDGADRKGVRIQKVIDGIAYTAVFEYRPRRRMLALVTMWKRKE